MPLSHFRGNSMSTINDRRQIRNIYIYVHIVSRYGNGQAVTRSRITENYDARKETYECTTCTYICVIFVQGLDIYELILLLEMRRR